MFNKTQFERWFDLDKDEKTLTKAGKLLPTAEANELALLRLRSAKDLLVGDGTYEELKALGAHSKEG